MRWTPDRTVAKSGCVIAVSGAVLLTGLVPAASAMVMTSRKPAPATGHMKMYELPGDAVSVSSGSFTVSAGHAKVTGLTLTVGPDALDPCGSGVVRLVGAPKIAYQTATATDGTSESVWGVNSLNRAHSRFGSVSVTLTQGGKSLRGGLQLDWESARAGAGDVTLRGCDLPFDFKHT